ncbi:tetratricopeptide repeat protein [Thauera phenolivorans]|uniref:tetratricopeptide repeat protein n=1 Tax=Thauera phenolivorans TaxID=1792543 RepID=UPI0018E33FC4|nr:SEL1-like repeat protein [Thauera phenolivorans]
MIGAAHRNCQTVNATSIIADLKPLHLLGNVLNQHPVRVADNREFFSAPANEVIRAIALAPGAIDGDWNGAEEEAEDDDLLSDSPVGDELDALSLPAREPWTAIFEEATCHHYGLGDFIQDCRQAIELYKQAARLGCLEAYARLGGLYAFGDEGVPENKEKALEYYKEGARKGSLYCYWEMGRLFMHSGQSGHENGIKCMRLFIKSFKERDTTSRGYVDNNQLNSVALSAGSYYLHSKFDNWYEIPNDILDFFDSLASRIAKECTDFAISGEGSGGSIYPQYRKVAEYYKSKVTS